MTAELIAQGAGYAVALVALVLAAIWYGWELRTRLALKLERFQITNREWVQYDEELRASRSPILPLRATVHDIRDRQSER